MKPRWMGPNAVYCCHTKIVGPFQLEVAEQTTKWKSEHSNSDRSVGWSLWWNTTRVGGGSAKNIRAGKRAAESTLAKLTKDCLNTRNLEV